MYTSFVTAVLVVFIAPFIRGHGRLLEPPGRSSMWRDPKFKSNPNVVINYDDNQLNCGGYVNQWEVNQGKCGVCGDPWQGPLENVPPNGKYARGIISRDYDEASVIDVKVEITADHKGYFEFRLCPNNDVSRPVTQECLDKTVLRFLEAKTDEPTRYYTNGKAKMYELQLQLPRGIHGNQVVLQWRYHAGNTWGCGLDQTCCVGCGEAQEEFYACADISIRPISTITTPTSKPKQTTRTASTSNPKQTSRTAAMSKPKQTSRTAAMSKPKQTTRTASTSNPKQTPRTAAMSKPKQTTRTPTQSTTPETGRVCFAIPPYKAVTGMDDWCKDNCKQGGYCPQTYCMCTDGPNTDVNNGDSPGKTCIAQGLWKGNSGMNEWCAANCPGGHCPPDRCLCF